MSRFAHCCRDCRIATAMAGSKGVPTSHKCPLLNIRPLHLSTLTLACSHWQDLTEEAPWWADGEYDSERAQRQD